MREALGATEGREKSAVIDDRGRHPPRKASFPPESKPTEN